MPRRSTRESPRPATPIETIHASRALPFGAGQHERGAIAAASRTPAAAPRIAGGAPGIAARPPVDRDGRRGAGRPRRARSETRAGDDAAQGSDDDDGRRSPPGARQRSCPSAKAVTSAPTMRRRERGHDHRDAVRDRERRGMSTTTARSTAPSTPSHSQPRVPRARAAAPPTRPARPGWWRTRSRPAPRRRVRWAAPIADPDVAGHTRRARTRPATTRREHRRDRPRPRGGARVRRPTRRAPSRRCRGSRGRGGGRGRRDGDAGGRECERACADHGEHRRRNRGAGREGAADERADEAGSDGDRQESPRGAEQGEHGERSAGHHERDEDRGEIGLGAEPHDALLRIDLPGRDARGQSRREREEPEDESRNRRDGSHGAGRDERCACVASNRSASPGDPREQCGHRPRDRRREPRQDLDSRVRRRLRRRARARTPRPPRRRPTGARRSRHPLVRRAVRPRRA